MKILKQKNSSSMWSIINDGGVQKVVKIAGRRDDRMLKV